MHFQIDQLFGVWKLLYINNSVFTYGPNLIGRIIITPEHYFNAMITDLPQLSAGVTWQNVTDSQRGVIAKPMTVYEGPVTLVQQDNITFTHCQVESSLDPEWVDTLQIRQADLAEKDGKKILSLTPWSVS